MPNDVAGGFSPLKKSLPIFIIIDVSGSMSGDRIAAVNEAMDKLVPEFKDIAAENGLVDFNVRVITYGNGQANWKLGTRIKGISVPDFEWFPISEAEVDGGTPADKAMDLLASVSNSREDLGGYIGTPMAILISDGESNGSIPFATAVDKFRATKYGDSFIQVAIGIATENNPRATDELKYFGRNGFKHCTDNPQEIVSKIKMCTIITIKQQEESSVKAVAVTEDTEIF